MTKERTIVVVPGLGDGLRFIRWGTSVLNAQLGKRVDSHQVVTHTMPWSGDEQEFQPK